MKAYVLHGIDDLRFETAAADPVPGKGEVIVAVKAAGICGSDIPRICQTGAHRHPLIPGHEFSGVVMRAGEGAGAEFLGQRVGVFPLIPCKACPPCRKEQYEMCRNYSYLGSRRDGGFAEYVSVPAENLILLPSQVSFEAAAMLEPMAVAVHAVRRTLMLGQTAENIQILDSCAEDSYAEISAAVCGLGTIGLLTVMLLKEAGISNVLTLGNKEFQRQAVLGMGVPNDSYCDTRIQDTVSWIRERTNGEGPDVFFECVGRNETIAQAVELTAPGGRIALVGNPYSDMRLRRDTYWKILRNQLTISGSWNSSFTRNREDDWHYALSRLEKGTIAPEKLISHKLSFENLETGLRIMRDKTEDYGKIMGIL